MSSEPHLPRNLGFTTSLAREAGPLILEGSTALRSALASAVDEKKNSVDLRRVHRARAAMPCATRRARMEESKTVEIPGSGVGERTEQFQLFSG
jgi:hypothetical protein